MSADNQNKHVVLAAGGTGGHIFPAEALAQSLIRRDYQVHLFTDNRYAKHDTTPDELVIHTVSAASPSGDIVKKLRAVVKLLYGTIQAKRKLKELKPKVVVGFGGYPSFPTLFAAMSLKIPVVIHEQNALMGRSNRFAAKIAQHIAVTYEDTKLIPQGLANKVSYTGNPVREVFQRIREQEYVGPKSDGSPIRLLITGGSLGAKIFSEVIPRAIILLSKELRDRLHVIQQCHQADIAAVEQAYSDVGIRADLKPFFEDLPEKIRDAHLVIARAGASTLAELNVAGRPAILVPYMYAMDDHQTVNALTLVAAGAAVHIPQKEFDSERLTEPLQRLLTSPKSLTNMAEASSNMGVVNANERLYEIIQPYLNNR